MEKSFTEAAQGEDWLKGEVWDGCELRVAGADGIELVMTVRRDPDAVPPWERGDIHGEVSDWTRRDGARGERVLAEDRGFRRFYDFDATLRRAEREGWSIGPAAGGSARKKARAAVERDFQALKSWCEDGWFYVGVCVRAEKAGVALTGEYDHAVWGIEANYPGSDNAYLAEVADNLAGEALEAARRKLDELRRDEGLSAPAP